ncbi:Big-1 (bacterial Ig-like domain 1) domain containing protein [Candidatus Nanopelagicaceae bacterium]
MSTKTTFKRIALVAVAALGFGVMTSVAPASAAPVSPTSIAVGTIPTAAVGVVHSTPITITAPYAAQSDTHNVTVRITSAPAGSVYAGTLGTAKVIAGTVGLSWIDGTVYSAAGNTTVAGKIVIASSAAGTVASSGVVSGLATNTTYAGASALLTHSSWVTPDTTSSVDVNITPDVAGTYTVLVSTNTRATAGTLAYAGGDANVTYTFTTGTAPTTATLAAVTGATVTGATNTVGRLMKVTLNTGAALGTGETIALTTNNTSASMAAVTASNGATGAYATTLTLDNSNFVGGVAYFKLRDTTATATTTVVTATGSGLLSSAVTSTISSTTVLLAASAAITVNNGVSAVRPGSGHVGGTAGATFTDTAATTATSHTYGLTSTAGTTAYTTRMLVTDTSGDITGIIGVTYETYVSTAIAATDATAGLGTVSFTATLAAGDSFRADIYSTTPASIVVTGETAVVTGTTGSATAEPASTMYATHGSSVVATVLVKDQFGAAVANSPVTVSVTGRNVTTASVALATDATGRASFTLADAGTAATAATQSVIVFDTALTANTNVTVNYGADKVATVTLETPTTDDTAASGITYSDINASSTAGASASTQTITATVKDVNGAVLVGVPVTFTTASDGAGILSTKVTVYTGTAGTAAASVYGWTAGVKTFTATAGAKSATGTVAFRQGGATGTNNPTEVRTISAVLNGNSIIVTAKDRFGNVVSGVPLWGTRTGNGTFGGGSNTNGQTTGVDGTAEFLFNAGSADSVVTITAGSATATPLPCYGQTGNLAGINACSTATTQTAYTAATVGTATTAQTGVGASLAPAGVGSVTVAVAAATDVAQGAADAAAEATDAANAATDAANAAAEAADAATAAAQDAADAVAALSTQVTEMVSALKKQITALTNLVIKIQKKVKA